MRLADLLGPGRELEDQAGLPLNEVVDDDRAGGPVGTRDRADRAPLRAVKLQALDRARCATATPTGVRIEQRFTGAALHHEVGHRVGVALVRIAFASDAS